MLFALAARSRDSQTQKLSRRPDCSDTDSLREVLEILISVGDSDALTKARAMLRSCASSAPSEGCTGWWASGEVLFFSLVDGFPPEMDELLGAGGGCGRLSGLPAHVAGSW